MTDRDTGYIEDKDITNADNRDITEVNDGIEGKQDQAADKKDTSLLAKLLSKVKGSR